MRADESVAFRPPYPGARGRRAPRGHGSTHSATARSDDQTFSRDAGTVQHVTRRPCRAQSSARFNSEELGLCYSIEAMAQELRQVRPHSGIPAPRNIHPRALLTDISVFVNCVKEKCAAKKLRPC